MARVKVFMNSAGAAALMNSAEIQGDLLDRAERVKSRAEEISGGNYVADVQAGESRAHAMVKTPYGDFDTMKRQARTNALLKSMDAGRG